MEDFHENLFRILGSYAVNNQGLRKSASVNGKNIQSLAAKERASRSGKLAILSLAFDILKGDKRLKTIYNKYGFGAAISVFQKGIIIHKPANTNKSTQTCEKILNGSNGFTVQNNLCLKTEPVISNCINEQLPILSSRSPLSMTSSCTSSSDTSDSNSDIEKGNNSDSDFDMTKALPKRVTKPISVGEDKNTKCKVITRLMSPKNPKRSNYKRKLNLSGLNPIKPDSNNSLSTSSNILVESSKSESISWSSSITFHQQQPAQVLDSEAERLEIISSKILTHNIPIDSLVFCQLVVFKHYHQMKNNRPTTAADCMQRKRDVLMVENCLSPFKKVHKLTVHQWLEKLTEFPRLASIRDSLQILPLNITSATEEIGNADIVPMSKRRK